MNLGLTAEQQMFQDGVERFLERSYPFERRRAVLGQTAGWDAEIWQGFVEMGLLGLPFPSDYGGLGCGPVETLIVMQAFGRHLVIAPYVATVVLAGAVLRQAASADQRARWIPDIVNGRRRMALAHGEAASRYNLASVGTRARRCSSGWILDGHKSVVPGVGQADQVIVSARTAGDVRDERGISLFLIDGSASGVSVHDYPCMDGTRAGELHLDGVQVDADRLIGEIDQAFPLIERAFDEGCAALCAEAAGAMSAMNAKTLAYTRERVAFNQPIAQFQVVQHRLVDMRVACEYAQAMALFAALKLEASAPERRRAISAAKYLVGRDSRFVAQNAIHLHGAMGMTDELDIGHYFKRLTAIGIAMGNDAHHLRRFWREWRGADALSVSGGERHSEVR